MNVLAEFMPCVRKNATCKHPPVRDTAPTLNLDCLDYDNYQPGSSDNILRQYDVTDSGSVIKRRSLSLSFQVFLSSKLGLSVTLWDGTHGLRGMSYSTVGKETVRMYEQVAREAPTSGQLQELKEKYLMVQSKIDDVTKKVQVEARIQELADQLATLEPDVCRLQRKVITLKSFLRELNDGSGSTTGKDDLLGRLQRAEDDLENATTRIRQNYETIDSLKEEVLEIEEGNLVQYAILERLFCGDPSGLNIVKSRSPRFASLGADAALIYQRRARLFRQYTNVKHFFVEAKMALSSLYDLESTVKHILENIHQAASASVGCQISPSSRLRYVRQLRDKAEEYYLNVVTLAPYTSLNSFNRPAVRNDPANNSKERWFYPLHRPEKQKSQRHEQQHLTADQPILFPYFDTSVKGSWSSAVAKNLSGLYSNIADIYKEISAAYDYQEQVIQKALADLGSASRRLAKTEHDLMIVRELIIFQR